jgi:predicted dehydrogenase
MKQKTSPGPANTPHRSDSDPLHCAIVGCGKVALKHLKAIKYPRADLFLAGLVDTRPDAARTLLRQAGYSGTDAACIPVYETLDELFKREKADLVAITTPSGSHYGLAKAALQAGAHVFIEKPLTLSLQEADELIALAADKGLQITVGHIYRFFPMVRAIEEDLRKGRFGRVLYGDVKVRWGHDQAYYDAAAWRGTWAQDGGALMNQSIHALDLMTWLLGGSVIEVSGWIDRQMHQIEAEDLGLAMLKLDNGAYCLLEGTTNTDPRHPEASFTIECSAGEIRAGLRDGKPVIRITDRRGRRLTGRYLRRFLKETWQQGGIKGFLQLKNPHSAIYGDLVRAIRDKRSPLADGLSGRQAVAAVLAIYASASLKRTVRLPLDDFALSEMEGFFPDVARRVP